MTAAPCVGTTFQPFKRRSCVQVCAHTLPSVCHRGHVREVSVSREPQVFFGGHLASRTTAWPVRAACLTSSDVARCCKALELCLFERGCLASALAGFSDTRHLVSGTCQPGQRARRVRRKRVSAPAGFLCRLMLTVVASWHRTAVGERRERAASRPAVSRPARKSSPLRACETTLRASPELCIVLRRTGAPRLSATPAEDNLFDGMEEGAMDDASTLSASNTSVVSHESDADSWSDTEEDSWWEEVREHDNYTRLSV